MVSDLHPYPSPSLRILLDFPVELPLLYFIYHQTAPLDLDTSDHTHLKFISMATEGVLVKMMMETLNSCRMVCVKWFHLNVTGGTGKKRIRNGHALTASRRIQLEITCPSVTFLHSSHPILFLTLFNSQFGSHGPRTALTQHRKDLPGRTCVLWTLRPPQGPLRRLLGGPGFDEGTRKEGRLKICVVPKRSRK